MSDQKRKMIYIQPEDREHVEYYAKQRGVGFSAYLAYLIKRDKRVQRAREARK